MKLKAKVKKDVTKVKVMFKSPMAGPEEAEKKKIKPEFIAHIIGKANGKVVYEVSTGGFISKNPLFKFQFRGAKKGDMLEVKAGSSRGWKNIGEEKVMLLAIKHIKK